MPINGVSVNGVLEFEVPDSKMDVVIAVLELACGSQANDLSKFDLLGSKWLPEICPFGYGLKTFIKNVDGQNDPDSCVRRQSYEIFTSDNVYHITAVERDLPNDHGYICCGVSRRMPWAGEDHTRGHDIHDGPFTRTTWDEIVRGIVRNELEQLAPPVENQVTDEHPSLQATWALPKEDCTEPPEEADIDVLDVVPEAIAMVERHYARDHRMVPIEYSDDVLTLAVSEERFPTIDAEELRFCLNVEEVKLVSAKPDAIDRALRQYYPDPEETAVIHAGTRPAEFALPVAPRSTTLPPEDPKPSSTAAETKGSDSGSAEERPPQDPEKPPRVRRVG